MSEKISLDSSDKIYIFMTNQFQTMSIKRLLAQK